MGVLTAVKKAYDDHLVPRAINVVLGTEAMGRLRRRALADLSGEVLEIGFGSGTNLPYYPDAVTKVIAVEPSPTGRRLAARRIAAAPMPVEFVGLVGESIPLPDSSVDHAVSTWTLCSVGDTAAVLAEVQRVLRPGGSLFFLEHGLSDDPKVASKQHRRNARQQQFAGGCRLTVRHDEELIAAGFEPVACHRFTIAGPRTMSAMYAGAATKPLDRAAASG